MKLDAAMPSDVRKVCDLPEAESKCLGLRPSPPPDSINVYSQRLIFGLSPLPNSHARPAVVDCSLNQSGSHWIKVNVIDLLHKHRLAVN